jgi:hypothetical protein
MADSYHLRLDLPRIAANRTAAGEPTDVAGVRAWLARNDVREQPDGWWLVEEIQLGLFGEGEVLAQRALD